MDGASRSEVILARRQDEQDARAAREESRRDRAERRGRRSDREAKERQDRLDAQRLRTQTLQDALTKRQVDRAPVVEAREDKLAKSRQDALDAAAADRKRETEGRQNREAEARRQLTAGDMWNLSYGYAGSLSPGAVRAGHQKGEISDTELLWISTARALAANKVSAAPKWIKDKADPERFIKNARYFLDAAHDRALGEKGTGGFLTQGEFATWVRDNKPKGVAGKPIDPTVAAMYLRFRLAAQAASAGAKKSSVAVAYADKKGNPIPAGRVVGGEAGTEALADPLSREDLGGVGASTKFLRPGAFNVKPKRDWSAGGRQGAYRLEPRTTPSHGGAKLHYDVHGEVVSRARYPHLNPSVNAERLRKMRLANKPSQGPKAMLSDEEYLLGEYGVR